MTSKALMRLVLKATEKTIIANEKINNNIGKIIKNARNAMEDFIEEDKLILDLLEKLEQADEVLDPDLNDIASCSGSIEEHVNDNAFDKDENE